MNFGFYLMTKKGLRVLDAVLESVGGDRIAYVVSARDRDIQNDNFEDIASRCAEHGISFFERRKPAGAIASYNFAVSWRWMIRDERDLIVLHDSLLPRYRGFAPLPTALINCEPLVGVTALLADENFDRGDIVGQRSVAISYPIKIQTAIDLIAGECCKLICHLCAKLSKGGVLTGQKQVEADATYSLWRDEEDYRIDWINDAVFIKRFVDSVGPPYNGASTLVGGRKVRILEAEVEPDVKIEQRQAGKVIFVRNDFPVVVCGRGLLRIMDLRDDVTGSSLLPLQKFRLRFI